MDENKKTLDASYFNNLYTQNQDPWNFEESEYERKKYDQTMLFLPDGVYASGFEIGCSNGLLSSMLRQRCQKLLAVDSSTIAVANAQKRLAEYSNVTVREMEIPNDFPDEKFDLILLSEVGYFLSEADLLAAREKINGALLPGGKLLLVHWTPLVDEFPLTGDQVHEIFINTSGDEMSKPLIHLKNQTEPQYRMDLFQRR
ncbi:SAM-dependent methyltransferase [Dyadobacter arcticus]|uniref:SAM-dependent methyltransferase n=1 Tax=Dyadobacter arcticus TaxID=1078754 RepID=A0ABX0UU76_9BACT|nr:SAM-dependent methyltransferase [Dyadobacter arcticus]NIJ54486.1 SAM-dependent methyltransferase [Dyadobacter arcticus]